MLKMTEKTEKLISIIILVVITVTVLSVLQFSYDKLQQDDYFHIRYSELMRKNGIYRHFPWLKYTILNENFYDKHFLYHVLLIPFTFGNLITTGKIASIIFTTFLGLLFFWILHKYGIRYPLFWSLLFMFGSKSLLVRLLALRPIAFAIAFFILGSFLLLQKKYLWVAIINFIFVLTYSAFVVFLAIAAVYVLSFLFYYRKLELKPILFSLSGILAGLIINPYFPKNFSILFAQYFKGSLYRSNLEPNLEWLPLSSWNLFLSVWAVFTVLFIVLFLILRGKKEHSFSSVFLFIQTVVFLLSYFKVSRGVDQFVPFAILFSAFAFSEMDIKIPKNLSKLIFILPAIALVFNFYSVHLTFERIGQIDDRGSALWLKENTRQGSHVFIANYGAFPQLFFYNQHNTYTLGLDPNFMKEYSEQLYTSYQDAIWLRKDPYPVIKDVFGASYVHVENISRSIEFYRYLNSHKHQFKKMYQDDFSAVFEVR